MKKLIKCKFKEPTVQQLQRSRMSELQNTMNAIFVSSDEESITRPEDPKMANLEKRMIQPQATIQGSNKRPKVKKNKKTVNHKEVIEDPPCAGDELRAIPPQPTVPTNPFHAWSVISRKHRRVS